MTPKRRCQHCRGSIARRPNERPNEYQRRVYCSVQCLGQSKVAKRVERFWGRVDKRGPDECWPWNGRLCAKGYGQFSTSDGPHRAHRFALAASGVSVPENAVVMHLCDNRPCCNPSHLRVGTYAENNRDMSAKGRSRNQYTGKLECA